jgi:hypothetical protein
MGAPFHYRNAIPDLSSSSPLHSMMALSSSPPLSPQSPTPQRNTASSSTRRNYFHSPTPSNPHPFSGSAKASLGSHPSSGKDQVRSKHLRSDPDKAASAGHKSWALPLAGPGANLLGREEAFEQHFFDSSDDASSSDWSSAAINRTTSTAPSSLQNVLPSIGLGIDSSLNAEGSSAAHDFGFSGLVDASREPASQSNANQQQRSFQRGCRVSYQYCQYLSKNSARLSKASFDWL